MPESRETVLNRKYIATLAMTAVAIIAVGLAIRYAILPDDSPSTAPLSEASSLQQLSREGQLNDIAGFVNERISASSSYVLRVPEVNSTGVMWMMPDSVVTTTDSQTVVAVPHSRTDSTSLRVSIDSLNSGSRWLVLVGRDDTNRIISWNGIAGGLTTSRCRTRPVEKMVLGFPASAEFAGAGVFSLSGQLVGMVVNCGVNGLMALPATEIARILADTTFANPASTADSVKRRNSIKRKR